MQPDADPVSTGEAWIAEGRAREAASLLQTYVDANRAGLLLRLSLQKALIACGDTRAALALARETALTNPDAAPAALGLGEALLGSEHLPAAIAEFQRALRLDPGLEAARIGLGSAWLAAGEPEKALAAWREVEQSASPVLADRIAEAENVRRQPRCDPRYVRHLFDQFAADYDARMLGQLHYQAPAILRQLADFLGLAEEKAYSVLDLGCGTGLMGVAVHDRALRLDGVDLSPAMIGKARQRGIYDELAICDIGVWLAESGRLYDLILAADTLVYIGDLAPLFASAARRLVSGGHFLFTVERKDSEGFELGPKRRWRHSAAYLRAEANRAGCEVAAVLDCELRTEAGAPVPGLAVALAKRACAFSCASQT
ncbi:MAG TPA: methyltransferase domain-containing protein [Rhizomicrobium sp.]|nr:methyltransferase domain-containing protein [Rhizomicrobium sp.]